MNIQPPPTSGKPSKTSIGLAILIAGLAVGVFATVYFLSPQAQAVTGEPDEPCLDLAALHYRAALTTTGQEQGDHYVAARSAEALHALGETCEVP